MSNTDRKPVTREGECSVNKRGVLLPLPHSTAYVEACVPTKILSCEWKELLMMTFLYYIRVVNWKELYHPIYTTYNVRCMFCMYCHCHTITRSREGVARHNDSRQCENVCGIHLRQNICADRCFEKPNICLFSVLSAETSLLYLFVSLK